MFHMWAYKNESLNAVLNQGRGLYHVHHNNYLFAFLSILMWAYFYSQLNIRNYSIRIDSHNQGVC